MWDFLDRLLRLVVKRSDLLDETDWEKVRSFESAVEELFSIPEFLQKTEFRGKALKVAKSRIDVEWDKGKNTMTDIVARTVMGETLNFFIDEGRQCIRFVAKELLKRPRFRSDLVTGMACFDYKRAVRFAKDSSRRFKCQIFENFRTRGCLARELRNVHMDDFVELVDDIRHTCSDDLICGPAIEDMVSFLSSYPELARWEHTRHVFRLCCLCLGHVVPTLPKAELGSSRGGTTNVDLSCIIEPLQGSLLPSVAQGNFITDTESIYIGSGGILRQCISNLITVFGKLWIWMNTRNFMPNWRNRTRL